MAIQSSMNFTESGLDMPVVTYVCVNNLQANQARHPETGEVSWRGSATVLFFVNRDAKYAGKAPLKSTSIKFTFVPSEISLMDAAYAALKSLPAFAGAIDV